MSNTHISLFTGRAGMDEGAEAAGFTTIGQSEVNKWCLTYLKEHYPDATQYGDIRKLRKIPRATVVSFGFPCQDISKANTKAPQGLSGERSGLFHEAFRLVRSSRPHYVVMENSPMLLVRGMHALIAAFTSIGYICEWQCLQAAHFGFPHKRERIYIIAYPNGKRWKNRLVFQPIKTIELSKCWTPDQAYIRAAACWAQKGRNADFLPHDYVILPGWYQEIQSIGNAVMPVIAEYLFKCVALHMTN